MKKNTDYHLSLTTLAKRQNCILYFFIVHFSFKTFYYFQEYGHNHLCSNVSIYDNSHRLHRERKFTRLPREVTNAL